MQNVDLRIQSYKQILVKNETKAAKKIIIFDFFQLNIFKIIFILNLTIFIFDHKLFITIFL